MPSSTPAPSEQLPRVATTFYPVTWLVERLAQGTVEVVFPLPKGEDPSTWQPARNALQLYQEADLVLINGAHLEGWVSGASLPMSRLVNTSLGFKEQWHQFKGVTHSHGAGGMHSHVGTDGHTWLSPRLFRLQAEAVAEALVTRGLVPEEIIAPELARLRVELEGLEQTIEKQILPLAPGVRFLTNHPAFNYLFDGRVDIVNLGLDPHPEDPEEVIATVREAARGAKKSVLLWEVAPDADLASALEEELGIESVLFSPAENPGPGSGDYLAIQSANLDRLRAALEHI